MDLLFETVYLFLDWLSEVSGFSYKEVNVIAYFIVLPAIYLHLLDRILRRHLLIPIFAVLLIALLAMTRDFARMAERAFDGAVDFLDGFEAIGWNYGTASVIVCVFAPLMLFLTLLHFAYPKVLGLTKRHAVAVGATKS